ncbi:S8 family serine peptidase [Lentzea sp. E54]|uniref:S8 family serine peptidase n=1 Tax=Lentzea xerophila TaxID=3435883 RepID=UPI003DA41818
MVPLVLMALVASGVPAAAAAGSLTITTVNGQGVWDGVVDGPLSGRVEVAGRASLGGGTPQPRGLVADAGDTPLVAPGEKATLLGSGYGGAAPYTFQWAAASGTVEGGDAPTAQLDTTGLPEGDHEVSLKVSDSNGVTATDTVKVAIRSTKSLTLLDTTAEDVTPGALSSDSLEFPFAAPVDLTDLQVTVSWTAGVNDYDLRLLGPDGSQRAGSGGGVPGTSESTGVAGRIDAGQWTVVVDKFASVADTVTVVVTGAQQRDPRPAVSAGGPYMFSIGQEQQVRATVSGGTQPVTTGWDTDSDGVLDVQGVEPKLTLPEGRRLVTVKAVDGAGLERRQTTSVVVADPARLPQQTTPITVVAINDTGINPYHLEFSADTYPDPDVLALTRNFTRHPAEYIPGYPADATSLPITHGKGYLPAEDKPLWDGNTTVKPGKMHWIPGTKIIGALDAGGSTGVTSGDDPHPILDDNGHGSGSASVSVGNRYGYCPTCLLVVVEALDEAPAAALPWVDVSSNSFGYVGGLPLGPVVGPNQETKAAAERGQTTLFAAGNGVGNAFDVPVSTYGSDQSGPDWNITVGALRRDNQRAVVGDGIPVHLSSWGDGNLPSACRTGTVGQCAFGGTSAATPYTAGVFGTVLTEVRRAVGDGQAGQKPGQVVAQGLPVANSDQLSDGKLTRAELREAVLKNAFPLNTKNAPSAFPYPLTAPYAGESNVLFEGYGAATPESARRAVEVLLGRSTMPERSFEDEFFALDRAVRDSVYGGYDRDGDGKSDTAATGTAITKAEVSTVEGALAALRKVAPSAPVQALGNDNPLTFFLHRRDNVAEPGPACGTTDNEQYLDDVDRPGDLEPCFESRVTSVAAAYRPLGIFPSTGPLAAPLPKGSRVEVELHLAGETPSAIRPTGVLMATDREIGSGVGPIQPVVGSGPGGAVCAALGEACWTKYVFSFQTTRHAFTGEQLTVQVQLLGARSWAFGFEGAHASKIRVSPAALPPTGMEFGVTITEPAAGSSVTEGTKVVAGGGYAFPAPDTNPTGAGDHPVQRRVEISVDDPDFSSPVTATLDGQSGTWTAPLGALAPGKHTVYARAAMDRTASAVAVSEFIVTARARVEWQVVERNQTPAPDRWNRAEGLTDWRFTFDTSAYGRGSRTIVARLVDSDLEVARNSVRAQFR